MRSASRPPLSVGGPVVLVNIHIRGRDLRQTVGAQVNACNPLFVDLLVYHTREWRHGLQRACDPGHTLNKEEGQSRPIRREARGLDITFQVGMLHRGATVNSCGPDLSGGNITGKIGDECQAFTVRGPSHIAERKVPFHSDRMRRPATCRNYGEFSIHNVSNLSSVGRDRNLIDLLGVRHGVKYGCGARSRGGRSCGGSVLGKKGSANKHRCDGANQRRITGARVRSWIHGGRSIAGSQTVCRTVKLLP